MKNSDSQQVLFAFDDKSLPFRKGLRLELIEYGRSIEAESNRVMCMGGPGAPDSKGILYYGTTLLIDGELWMWYLGVGDHDERRHLRVCFAKSKDGQHWEKPNLGLVEYAGTKNNNLIDLMGGKHYVNACVVFHEPDEPNAEHRFKMIFETRKYDCQFAVAYLQGGDLEVVPEPGTWALMLGGLALLVVIQRRRSARIQC